MTDRITRRRMLTTSAIGAGLLASGVGVPALAQEAAPEQDLPVGAAGKLTVIHRTEYFEEAQNTFRQVAQDFADANNVELDISTTNPEAFGDFLGKMSAAVQAGNPPDLAYTSNVSIRQMALLGLLEDVTDVVEEAQSRYGNVVAGINADALGQVDGRWMAVPFLASSVACLIRADKLAEAGIDPATLTTWDARRDAALAMSDPDNEFWGWGLTPNQSGDGYGFLMQVIHAHGGSFTDESGMRVVFDSPETVAALAWLGETYDRNGPYAAMLPPGIESWGDSSNNEAWLAGSIGYTHNSWSVYAQSKRDENPVFANTMVLPMPNANNGDSRAGGETTGWLTVFRGAPNAELAKQLALNLLDPANFNRMSAVAGGLFNPAFENLWTEELLAADPNFAIIREQVTVPEPHLVFSWPAQPNAAIDAIRPLGIVEQAVGNVIAGRMTPEEAAADAHNKIVNIFEEGGISQD
jgi:multiple sugar transport system substrate-binding protein